ncbi:MAG TPA: DegT/DnrJ/EryC1/StrS family aminotransferase [Acidothermaceae bacterium]|jgi:dTDP-4-amino-4,6-dideoxygalactose transaminase|nr:DegT/DnrJ/EryC1/StrS family aminotransferase [Acidothermaceae bacterium]
MTGATIDALHEKALTMIPVMKPWLGDEEAAAAAATVASGWVAQGPRVAEFESTLAGMVGAAAGVAVSSCTTGLHLALIVAGVTAGDEVIVPSLSFIATANAARYCGAEPVFADVDPHTLNLTPETIEQALTDRTKAVILVHQAGIPADIDAIRALCADRGVAVIEDAACAIGSTYQGQPIGAHSDLVVFSFHPRKVITTGEGGMVMTRDVASAERMYRLREHGMNVSAAKRHNASTVVLEQYVEVGFNYRMTDLQAAVGLVQLRKLDEIVQRRRELAARYHEAFADLAGITMAADPSYGTSNFQSFWLLPPADAGFVQAEFLQALLADGISARRGIMAAHLEPAYADVNPMALPVTEEFSRRSVILPIFHTMTPADQDRVIDSVRRELGGLVR